MNEPAATVTTKRLHGAFVFSEAEALQAVGPVEFEKHKGQSLCALTVDLFTLKVALDKSGKAPERVLLFPFGETLTTKGSFYLSQASAMECLAAEADYGNDLCIDRDHMALMGDSTAYGWFSLEVDAEGLWAGSPRNMEGYSEPSILWLDDGRALVEGKKYRYISPVFWCNYDDQGRAVICEVLNFSLTNIPATKKRAPLINSRDSRGERLMGAEATVTTKPSASTDVATEAKVLAAVYALTGETDLNKALGKLAALSEIAGQLTATKESLSTALVELKSVKEKLKVLTIDRLIEQKKLPPSMKEKTLSMAPEALDACVEMLAGLGTLPTEEKVLAQPAEGSAETVALSAEEEADIKKYNLDRKVYIANKLKFNNPQRRSA